MLDLVNSSIFSVRYLKDRERMMKRIVRVATGESWRRLVMVIVVIRGCC